MKTNLLKQWLSFAMTVVVGVMVSASAFAGEQNVFKVHYKVVPETCLKGGSGSLELYVNTGAGINMQSSMMIIGSIAGVNFDPSKVVFGKAVHNTPAASWNGEKVKLNFAGNTGNMSVMASAEDQLVATLPFTLNEELIGAMAVPFELAAVVGNDGNTITKANYVSDDIPSTINFTIVKAFNAADVAETTDDWDGSDVTIAADKFSYSDDKGAAVSGSVTKVGDVTCSITDIDFGSFAPSNGGIKWTPAAGTKADIGHQAAIFTIPFTATGEKGSDDATLTLTVNPANTAPVLDGFTVTKNTEGDYFVIELFASDADGDPITFSEGGYFRFKGTKIGEFSDNVWTSSDVIDFDEVGHPDKSIDTFFACTMSDGIAEVPVSVDVTIIDKDQLPTVDDFSGASVAITPASPTVTDTLAYTLEGAPYADADGDLFAYSYAWSKSTPYTKGDEVVLNVTATTNPYGEGTTEALAVATNSVVIVNSVPVITAASPAQIFIQKGTATSGTSTITATDADNDDLTFSVVSNDTTKGTASFSGNVLSYAVKNAEASEVTDTIIIKANDGEADSATFEVTVLYCENPVPEIVSIVFSTDDIPEVDDAGQAFTFTATVTATDKAAGTIPAAVGALTVETEAGLTAEVIATEGDNTRKTYTVQFTTDGYDAVAHPDSSKQIAILFKVIDDESKSYGTADSSVEVDDVDRLPSGPTAVNRTPEFAFHGDSLTAEGAGAQDEDGDAITYAYTWAYSTDGGAVYQVLVGETGATLSKADVIKKGYMVKATAVATTDPYGDGSIVSSEGTSDGIWEIGNTVPYFVELGDQKAEEAEDDLKFTWVMDEDCEEVSIAAVARDVDVEDGVDSLTYEVSELDESIGVLAIDEATGIITFTPAPDFNTSGMSELPFFTVAVFDESGAGASNTATVELKINEVNDKPVVHAADEYVLPDERGDENSVDYEVTMGPEGEESQELTRADLVGEADDPDQILESYSVEIPEYDKRSVTLNYVVKENAPLGKSAKVTFTVTDNGTTAGAPDPKTSDPVTVTIFVGASPWYPIISLECSDPEAHADGHTFHLAGNDGSVYDLTIKESRMQLLPADYAAAGVPGYTDDATVDVTVYVWTMDEGTTEEVCEAKEITVSAYGLPGEPFLYDDEDELTADERGWFTLPEISVPMAKSYTIVITNENGDVVKEIGPVDFEADKNGMILPEIKDLSLQLTEEGLYTVSFQGTNPNGDGEAKELIKVTVPQNSEEELAWGAGDFLPAKGSILTNGSVKFSWPVAAAADSYTVKVIDTMGYVVAEESDIYATNVTIQLPIDETPEAYTWTVTAVAGKKSLTSNAQNFTLATTTRNIIVTQVTAGEGDSILVEYEGILADVDVAYDYQYFSIADMTWYNGVFVDGEVTGEGIKVIIDGVDVEAGDYVVLRLFQDGQQVGDWIAYQVQERRN